MKNKFKIKDNNIINLIKNYSTLLISISLFTLIFICFNISSFQMPDEISFLYNCKTVAETGSSAFGDKFPIYFNTWLVGGHSPLPIYVSALFVKLFGVKLISIRLAQFIFNIITIIFVFKTFNLLFNDKKRVNIATFTFCFMGQTLFFSGCFMDCHWANYFISIGLYCFIYALKKNKHIFLPISTAIFCLSFYCYGLLILIIPPLLVSLYIIFYIKKQITIKEIILNTFVAIIISLPFILFGFVVLGILKPFSLCGITFPDMSLYCRNTAYIKFELANLPNNILHSIAYFTYFSFFDTRQHILSACLTILIIVLMYIVLTASNKKLYKSFKNYDNLNKCLFVSALVPLCIYCLFITNSSIEFFYRNSSIVILITIVILPLIFKLTYNINKKILLSVIISSIVVLTLTLPVEFTTAEDITNYVQENKIEQMDIYTTYPEKTAIEKNNNYKQAWWSYKFRLDIPTDNYINFKDEQIKRYSDTNTVQISNRIKTTISYEDLDKTHYVFALEENDEFIKEGRKLIKEFKYADCQKNTYYLYSPVL